MSEAGGGRRRITHKGTFVFERIQCMHYDSIGTHATHLSKNKSTFILLYYGAYRYQRAVDKIQELLMKVQSGKQIDESEIPVAIRGPAAPAVTKLPPPPVPQRPSIASASVSCS